MAEFMVREDGKNGTVAVHDDRIVRTFKKRIGKDDINTIPVKAITSIHHDRKTIGTDIVHLQVGSAVTYEWKIKNAEQMVTAVQQAMFN